MHLFKQKINWPAIVGQVGLLLHVPAGMAALTLIVALVFKERFSLIPFGTVAVFSLVVGQTLYRATKGAKGCSPLGCNGHCGAGVAPVLAYRIDPFCLDLSPSTEQRK